MTAAALARLPLRVRLVAGFSATMLLVLLAAGGFVYWRVHFALDRQVNEDLTEISTRLAPLVTGTGALSSGASASDRNEIYQVLDDQGRVLSASPTAGPDPLLDATAARQALSAPVRRDLGALLPIKNHPLRAYAVPLPRTGGAAAVLVVAVRRDHRDEALLELLLQLAIAGLGALVLTSAVATCWPGSRCGRWSATGRRRTRSSTGSRASGSRSPSSATTRSPGSATPST